MQTRTYYIASEEVVWDYVSEGRNVFLGRPFQGIDSVFAGNIPGGPHPRIGRQYLKARRWLNPCFSFSQTQCPALPGVFGFDAVRANVL